MDQESIRICDEISCGDVVEVHFRRWLHATRVIEGEFLKWDCRCGTWYMVIAGKARIRTIDLQMVRVITYAGCL